MLETLKFVAVIYLLVGVGIGAYGVAIQSDESDEFDFIDWSGVFIMGVLFWPYFVWRELSYPNS